jgi:hypothetical protein
MWIPFSCFDDFILTVSMKHFTVIIHQPCHSGERRNPEAVKPNVENLTESILATCPGFRIKPGMIA